MKRVLAWALPVAAAAGTAPLDPGTGGDSWLFVAAGRTLLSGHWSRAFADPGVQVGPLQLALFGSVGRSHAALAAVLGGAAALLVLLAARRAGVERPGALAAVGALAVLTGLTRTGADLGHPADTLLPLLWVLAAVEARRGRTLLAGALVGLGAGLETWSVLGLAVLALAPRGRDAVRGVGAAAAAGALLFGPFALAGHFEMLRFHWTVVPSSLLSHVVAPGTAFGWPLRLAQAAVALGAGVALARAARPSKHVVWLVPALVVLVRLALDPTDNPYYFAAVEGPALVGAALLALQRLDLRTRQAAPLPLSEAPG